MKSKEYWNRRFLIDKAGNINSGEKFLKSKTEQYYEQAHKEIQETIEKFYKKFADKNNITLAEAKRLIKNSDFKKTDFEGFIKEQAARNKELKEKKNSLPKEILESIQEQNAEYEKLLSGFTKKGQITRLELLWIEIEKILLDLYDTQQINIYEYLSEQYTDSYYKSVFNTQQSIGFGKDFATINREAVDRSILNTYSRNNYSETIWEHRQALSEDLRSNITTGLIRGEALEKMASRISKRLEVSKSNAYRLVRTETAYIYEQATKKAYEECDIEKYKYLATLDRKTSKTCKKLDGKVFNVKDALPGKNYPPMHPNCRSSTVCYFDDDVVTSRLAKDSSGKYYEVPSDMTYNEWYKGLSEDEKGRMTILNKMDKNKSADKKQLSKYKEVLGKETPSLSKYQDMKYNETKEYKLLNNYKKAVKKGDINVLTSFEEYKKVDKEITEKLHGIVIANGIEIKDHSLHFIDRVIGAHSYEDEGKAGLRRGVKLEDIERILKTSKDFGNVVEKSGKKSQKVFGNSAYISINPDTGILIQVQPRKE